MALKWSISRISKKCRKCEKDFYDGEAVYSCIVIGDGDDDVVDTERFDFCVKCWDEDENAENPFWKCIFRAKEEDETKKMLDKDFVMSKFLEFLKQLDEEQSKEKKDESRIREIEALLYLLALILERKKRLVFFKNKSATSSEYAYYKDSKSADIYRLKIPEFSDDEVVFYQDKLKSILPDRKKAKKNKSGN